MGDVEYFGKIKFSKGLSKVEQDKLDTERYLNCNESVRVPVEQDDSLSMLFRRGDLLKASELEAKKLAELETQKEFEAAVEEQARLQKTKISKGGVDQPSWTRERFEE